MSKMDKNSRLNLLNEAIELIAIHIAMMGDANRADCIRAIAGLLDMRDRIRESNDA